MVISCVALNCTNRQSYPLGQHKKRKVQFHRFPSKNPQLLEKWAKATKRASWSPTLYSYLCSDHFTVADYLIRPGTVRKHLKPDAVPSVFNFSVKQRRIASRKGSKKDVSARTVISQHPEPASEISNTLNRLEEDVNVAVREHDYVKSDPLKEVEEVSPKCIRTLKPVETSGFTLYETLYMEISLWNDKQIALKAEQMELLKTALRQEITKPEGRGVGFSECTDLKGILYMTCSDKHTKNWLIKTVPQLKPWEGAQFRIRPSLLPVKRCHVSVTIPFPYSIQPIEDIIKAIGHQNQHLNVDAWKIVTLETGTGTRFTVEIDSNDLETLQRVHFEVFLGLTKVTFSVVNANNANSSTITGEKNQNSQRIS